MIPRGQIDPAFRSFCIIGGIFAALSIVAAIVCGAWAFHLIREAFR